MGIEKGVAIYYINSVSRLSLDFLMLHTEKYLGGNLDTKLNNCKFTVGSKIGQVSLKLDTSLTARSSHTNMHDFYAIMSHTKDHSRVSKMATSQWQ